MRCATVASQFVLIVDWVKLLSSCRLSVCFTVFQAFFPLLKKAASASGSSGLSCCRAAVLNFSTRMGSIDDNTSGGKYAYRSSKVVDH